MVGVVFLQNECCFPLLKFAWSGHFSLTFTLGQSNIHILYASDPLWDGEQCPGWKVIVVLILTCLGFINI